VNLNLFGALSIAVSQAAPVRKARIQRAILCAADCMIYTPAIVQPHALDLCNLQQCTRGHRCIGLLVVIVVNLSTTEKWTVWLAVPAPFLLFLFNQSILPNENRM
jgi:hypothetical protein